MSYLTYLTIPNIASSLFSNHKVFVSDCLRREISLPLRKSERFKERLRLQRMFVDSWIRICQKGKLLIGTASHYLCEILARCFPRVASKHYRQSRVPPYHFVSVTIWCWSSSAYCVREMFQAFLTRSGQSFLKIQNHQASARYLSAACRDFVCSGRT